MKVVDFYGPHDEAFYRCLKSNGVDGIARYLVNAPASDPRAITPDEVRFAHAAGLDIHFFFEMDPTYVAYFTYDRGTADARAALSHLRSLAAPPGRVVYFAVDAPPSTIPPTVLDAYFNGIEDTLSAEGGGLIVPGLYGFQAHVEHARANYPNVGKHPAQTYGTVTGELDLWQHLQMQMCGVQVDIDDVSVPGWAPEEDDMDGETVKDLIREMLDSIEGAARVGAAWERSLAKAKLDTKLDNEYVKKTDGAPPHGHTGTVEVR